MNRNIYSAVIKYAVMILVVAVTLFPFFYVIRLSLQETIFLGGTSGRENEFSLGNYLKLFTKFPFFRWLMNSAIVTLSVALIKVLIDTMSGYALARFDFPGSKLFFGFVLAMMMFPAAITLLPVFKIIAALGLINTYPAIVLPMIANPFGIFLMRQFVLGLPKSIEESAVIDGCSNYKIFFRIVAPMTRPGQVVVFTVHSMWAWTSLIWPLIMAREESMFTVTLGLSTLSAFTKTDYGALAAGLMISLLPPFLFFLVGQRGFIEGITMGALKE